MKTGKWMPITYKVSVAAANREGVFHITWLNLRTNKQDSFEQSSSGIMPEEVERLWKKTGHRLDIGNKLFRFLDGDCNYLQRGLKEAANYNQSLQIHLVTGSETLDWPFELLSQGDSFLLPNRIHLVRRVSDWGSAKLNTLANRRLRVLFMACSALNVEPELDYEGEEEAIFKITENLAIDMVVEDSGSLEGLREKLMRRRFDVVHLSGHADIHKNRQPFFLMEDETGNRRDVSAGELWQEALIDNPPRLLFLSGCRTGEAPEGTESSFARQLVKEFNVPAVLGWGRSVEDVQAIEAEEIIYRELSRGESIVHAVQQARNKLFAGFEAEDSMDSDWPLLRLFCSGVPLNAIVEKEQKWQPKVRKMKHVYLKNSKVQVLEEGFVGRRRQLQQSVKVLKRDMEKVGILMLGTAGLGKSCLAGKVSERFKTHTLVIVNGRLNEASLRQALKDAFIEAGENCGKDKLAGGAELKEILGDLCASCFKEKNYLILLDDFDLNLEGAEKGQPDRLLPEAAELLHELLYYLPFCGKMTHLIITCRYGFALTAGGRDLVTERLEPVWLTGLRELSLLKKAKGLEFIDYLPGWGVFNQLLTVSCGNPRLMEWLDGLGEQIDQRKEQELLKSAFHDKQEAFIVQYVIRELLQWGGDELTGFLRPFAIFRKPVPETCAREVAEKVGQKEWKDLLHKGMKLSLVEYNRARKSYRVTPLLREELLKHLDDLLPFHQLAFEYYNRLCGGKPGDQFDRSLAEEWVYHAESCGKGDSVPQRWRRMRTNLLRKENNRQIEYRKMTDLYHKSCAK
jgi:hypothetical protein